MKMITQLLRTALLLAALAATALALSPGQAEAWKSCEYYCGNAGPYTCYSQPHGLNCTTWIAQ